MPFETCCCALTGFGCLPACGVAASRVDSRSCIRTRMSPRFLHTTSATLPRCTGREQLRHVCLAARFAVINLYRQSRSARLGITRELDIHDSHTRERAPRNEPQRPLVCELHTPHTNERLSACHFSPRREHCTESGCNQQVCVRFRRCGYRRRRIRLHQNVIDTE